MSDWTPFLLPRFQVPGFARRGWACLIFCLAAIPGTSLEAQDFDCILLNDNNTNIFMVPDACFTKENIDWCNCVDSGLTHPVRGETSGFRQAIQWISGQPGIGNHIIEIEEGTLDLSSVSPGDLLGTGEALELIPLGFPFVGGNFFGVDFAVTATAVENGAVDFQVSITSVTAAVLEAIGYDPTDAEHSNGHMLTGQIRDNDGQGLVIEYRYATENYTATTVPGLLPTEASMPIFTVPFILEFFSRESGIYTLPETGDVDVTTTIRSFLEDTVADIPPLGTTDLCAGLDDFTFCKIISEIVELRDSARDNNPPSAAITPVDPGIFLMLDEPVNLDTFCGRSYILLRGRNSNDGDGGWQELRYRWDIVDGTEGGAEIYANTRNFKDTHVIFTQAGIYEIRLRVDDGSTGEHISEAFVTISVSTDLDFNAPPFVVLQTRPDPPDVQLNRRSASVVLDAAGSDGGGEGCEQEVTFLWRQIDGPARSTINSPRAATTEVTFDTPGTYLFELEVDDGGFQDNITVAEVEVVVLAEIEAGTFRRGDADDSGRINITDAIAVLNWLFLGSANPSCTDAADVDDNGRNNITDAIQLLQFLFLGGPPPPAPGKDDCGMDPTADPLSDCNYLSCGD